MQASQHGCRKLSAKAAAAALPTLQQLNEQQVKLDAELRYLLYTKLKMRNVDGKLVLRPVPHMTR